MLVPQRDLPGIRDGSITLAFRRWRRPGLRAGGRQRIPGGVLHVDAIDVVEPAAIGDEEVRRAGYADRAELEAALARHPDGVLYRIAFHLAGPDERVALREAPLADDAEWEALRAHLERLDRRVSGPWTRATLELIATSPGVLAGELARRLGRERLAFKADVRRLKELGLTESLPQGYRLSPRGRSALERLGPV